MHLLPTCSSNNEFQLGRYLCTFLDCLNSQVRFILQQSDKLSGELIRDSQTREQALEAVGVIYCYLMRYKKHFFHSCIMTVRDESVSSLFSILFIISLASSAHMVIASDWPYLSLTAEATISVGGMERWQFD